MGFIDRVKAFVAPFAVAPSDRSHGPSTNNATSMPDISTQTPAKWASNTDTKQGTEEASPARPKARHGIMAAQMGDKDWKDSWDAIDKWSWRRGGDDDIIDEDAPRLVDEEMLDDYPPTPGSGRGGESKESSPLQLAQAGADAVVTGDNLPSSVMEQYDGDIAMTPLLGFTEAELQSEASMFALVSDQAEADRSDAMIVEMDKVTHVAAALLAVDTTKQTSDNPKTVVEARKDSAIAAAQVARPEDTLPADGILTKDGQDDGGAAAEAQLHADAMDFVSTSPVGDLTLPLMPSVAATDLEELLRGIRSHSQTPAVVRTQTKDFLQRASPSFPFDIASAGQAALPPSPTPVIVNALEESTSGAQILDEDEFIVDAQKPEPDARNTALNSNTTQYSAPVDLKIAEAVSQQPSSIAQGSTDTESGRSQIASGVEIPVKVVQPDHQRKLGSESAREEQGQVEGEVTSPASATNPSITTSPERMPVKLPDSFQEAVLAEAVRSGAKMDEQYYIMEGIRGIERQAGLAEVDKVEGAMEVDKGALASRAHIGPAAPAPPMEPPGDKGKKRKSEAGEEGTKDKKSKSKIQALTDEEHFANGWTYQPQKVFESWKAPQLRDYLRTIASQKRWWNGLNKKSMTEKIMQWQEDMKQKQEEMIAEQDANDSQATVPEKMEGVEPIAAPSRAASTAASIKQPASRAAPVSSRKSKSLSKSKSKTPAPQTPTDQVTDTTGFVRGSSGGASAEKSVFFDPDASQRSTPFVEKLHAVKKEGSDPATAIDVDDGTESMPKSKKSGFSNAFNAALEKSQSNEASRRSRSKTADSAKHGVVKVKSDKGSEGSTLSKSTAKKGGRGSKSKESSEASTTRARSLRSRTSSVAPEAYGA